MKLKKVLILTSAVIAIAALLSVGTYAFLTREDTARNVITMGNVDFEIHENMEDGSEFPAEGIEIIPGDTVSKIVTVKNTGGHPLYLRIKLTKTVNDPSLTVDDKLTVNINNEDWTEKEGFYYYNEALAPGEETAPLFTEVHADGASIGNEFLGKIFTLKVDGYAVQSENNGESVDSAIGWPEVND